jgi:hypothetical protein
VAERGYSIADLSRRWKIGSDKIRSFLRRGELIGIKVASDPAGRPQWRITQASVEAFERRRSSAPAPKPARRRMQRAPVDYLADV